jgi:3-oxoacyl-[acyl-carrier-protein] synthase-3
VLKTVSLMGVASYLPETLVRTDFFAPGAAERRGMFTAPSTRRHVRADESAEQMITGAAERLIFSLHLDPRKDIDILFTNVSVPDQPFTGCGAAVAHRLGARPRWVIDLHNTGCISFVYMIELARLLMSSSDARSALLCNVQNAGGRVFSQPGVRLRSQAPVPGDGCGVGYLATSAVSPVISLVQRCHAEFAHDMSVRADDGRRYWEPGTSPIAVEFNDDRVASIISRGNAVVPEVVQAACDEAGLRPSDIRLLVTNQPNPIFLRNWREALELPPERHHDTFDRYGNLFGAAIPINLEDALAQGKLRPGELLALAGFSHAGDYAAAALIRWQAQAAVG